MPSFLIHLATASKINEIIKKDERKILLGAIAPDISKFVGLSRDDSHFIKDGHPFLSDFLAKYKNNLDDDFVLGYFIHLYTDYLWSKYFISEIYDEDKMIIHLLSDEKIKNKNDYSFVNEYILNKYDLNLNILKNVNDIETQIDEIPYDKLDVLVFNLFEMMKDKRKNNFIFNNEDIDKFIDTSVMIILGEINSLEVFY